MGRAATVFMAAWVFSTGAVAAGLDDPIVERPTPRSEIKRGYEAGADCPATIAVLRLADCFKGVLARYRLTHSNTDAFEAGLAFAKFVASDIQAKAYGSGQTAELAAGNATIACYEVASAAAQAGIKPGDVIVALGPVGTVHESRWRACAGPLADTPLPKL
jgi:hypothetical protein